VTNGRVEVITSVQRRRRWSASEKQQLVAASLEPGAPRPRATPSFISPSRPPATASSPPAATARRPGGC
jgi:transposase-like protein